jgi:hypothetical protein
MNTRIKITGGITLFASVTPLSIANAQLHEVPDAIAAGRAGAG